MSVSRYKNSDWEEISAAMEHNGTDWTDKDFIRKYENGSWVDKWMREVILDHGTIVKDISSTTIEYADDYSVSARIFASTGNRTKAATLTFWAEGTFVNPSLSLDFIGNSNYIPPDTCAYGRVFADNNWGYQRQSSGSRVIASEVFTGTFHKIGFELILYRSAYYSVVNIARATAFYLNDEKLRITARP